SPPITPTWTVDCGDPAYFRFFAIPDFARGKPPLQIVVVVPLDQMAVDPRLVQSLQLNKLFSSSKHDLARLPITNYLIQALSFWSSRQPDFQEVYLSMPYASQIVVETLHQDCRQTRIHLDPSYHVERQWLSVLEFEGQTDLDLSCLATLVDWSELELVQQLHESITLVRVPSRMGPSSLMVYKAVTEDLQYMYHELRVMLSMASHPCIIGSPNYVVVKQCRFGGKLGICGFLLDYHPHGSLQTALQSGEPITLRQKLYWAESLLHALVHVRDNGPGFYSDLKPNNVLLVPATPNSRDGLTAPLLIDFEQRGSWYGWSPPEVQYVEFLDMLATKASSEATRNRYSKVMQECFPELRAVRANGPQRTLKEAPNGFSLGWTSLDVAGRQRAQVFGVGKLLWCIFEELPSCNSFLSIETFAEGIDQEQRFPEFRKTPGYLRELIRRCTAGAPEWEEEGFPIGRRGDKLVPLKDLGVDSEDVGIEEGPDSVGKLAREWWKETVQDAENY
ncbi:hypothetical protein B0T16DRAFT_290127, partial [Cercophora newfieldiana]